MSALAWLSREEMVALGWTLLHFCWQGTAVALAYTLVDRLTSRTTSKVRYAVALAALMIMPALVLGTFALEMRTATPTRVAPTRITKDATQPLISWHRAENATPIVHELPLASNIQERGEWLVMRAEQLLPGWMGSGLQEFSSLPCVPWADGGSSSCFAETPCAWCRRTSSAPSSESAGRSTLEER